MPKFLYQIAIIDTYTDPSMNSSVLCPKDFDYTVPICSTTVGDPQLLRHSHS